MPETLKVYLQSLPHHLAKEVWEWLDATPHAESEMIEVIAVSNPQVVLQLCGPPPDPNKEKHAKR